MVPKLWIWPVQISNERLEGVQLPEQIFRSGTPISTEEYNQAKNWAHESQTESYPHSLNPR